MIMGLGRTYHADQFIFSFFSFTFLFVPCGRLSWLSVSFLLHVKYTVSYRTIVRMMVIDPPENGTQRVLIDCKK